MSRIDPPRVHYRERPSIPYALCVQAVAGSARSVIDDREPLSNETIEECALADVWPSDQRYDGIRHVFSVVRLLQAFAGCLRVRSGARA